MLRHNMLWEWKRCEAHVVDVCTSRASLCEALARKGGGHIQTVAIPMEPIDCKLEMR